MTKTSWKQFLLLQLPVAALVLTAVFQAVAFVLSDVPVWRARYDEVALATLKDPSQFRILLLGDSITSMATGRFSLGAPGEIGNISTHGGVGVHGALFQLQRYLSAHPSPEHVVLVYAPVGYKERKSVRKAHYDMWHVYNLPDERDFLRTYIPGIGQRDWLPAIFDVQERIVEPFTSLVVNRNQQPRMDTGSLTANPDTPAGMAARAETPIDDAIFTPMRDTSMSPAIVEALTRMCSLSRKHGFRIEVAWPPLPAQLESSLVSSGALAELEARIGSIMAGHCDFAGFTDFNKIRAYPDSAFRNDLIHLFDYGWEQRYTADLSKYLRGLRDPVPDPAPAIGGQAVETTGVGHNLPDQPGATPNAAARVQ
jgi:hypothetical protein